jgi:hypothetical protein
MSGPELDKMLQGLRISARVGVSSELVRIARDLVAIPTRKYHQGCEGVIASEIVLTGESSGWISEAGERTWGIAQQVERRLSHFNIGYFDDKHGEWHLIRGGTKFFQDRDGTKWL